MPDTEMNPRLRQDPPLLRRPKLVKPGEGLAIWWMGDDRITFQAVSEDTGGAYAFWIDEPPAGVGPPRHVHSREEEGFYVVSGEADFRAGHIDAHVGKDTFIALLKGIPHGWRNVSEAGAKLITFTAAGGNEGFFLKLGAPGDGPPGPRATMALDEINRRTGDRRKIGGAAARWVFSRSFSDRGWMRGLDVEVGESRG